MSFGIIIFAAKVRKVIKKNKKKQGLFVAFNKIEYLCGHKRHKF